MSTPSPEKDAPRPPRRWRRRLLRATVILATLIAAFYIEENWRGTRAWNAARARLESRNEPLTIDQLLTPVREEENFYAAPLIQERSRGSGQPLLPLKSIVNDAFREAFDEDKPIPDLSAALKLLRSSATWPLPAETGKTGADILAVLAPAENAVKATREATGRPHSQMLPWQMKSGSPGVGFSFHFDIMQLYSLRSAALLAEGRVAEAGDECLHTLRLARCLAPKLSFLMQKLLSAAINGEALNMLLAHNGAIPWSIKQLEAFDKELATLAYSDHFEDALRAERVFALALVDSLGFTDAQPGVQPPLVAGFYPSGWRSKWKASLCDALQETIDGIIEHGLRAELDQERPTGWFPPQSFAAKDFSTRTYRSVMRSFLIVDARIRATRLALAAMRWHLEKNAWPDSLGALTIYFPDGFPADPISSQPFTTAVTEDGGYKICAPGFNEGDADDDIVTKLPPPARRNP